jgi:hypothetical protein
MILELKQILEHHLHHPPPTADPKPKAQPTHLAIAMSK